MNSGYPEDFPYNDRIYLNNASTSRMPIHSIDAMSKFLFNYNNYGPDSEQSDAYVKEKITSLRKSISQIIRCRPEEIVLTQSVTDGINFVAGGMKFSPNSNIITRGSNHEHPANHYPWVRAGQRVELRELAIDENGYFDHKQLIEKTDSNTRLVVMSHALFNTGSILPVEEIGGYLAERNIPYFVDAAQTVGCLPDVDVNRIGCNFMSFNGSKWLCGPMGMGIFYCRRDSSEMIEPLQIGGESAIFYENTIAFKEMPARFQAGFRNWAGVAGLEASVNYVLKIGMDKIRNQNVKLARILREELSRMRGVSLIGPQDEGKRTSIVSFTIEGQNPETVVKRLEKENIILAVREILSKKIIRASPHFFNTEQEILKVTEALKR